MNKSCKSVLSLHVCLKGPNRSLWYPAESLCTESGLEAHRIIITLVRRCHRNRWYGEICDWIYSWSLDCHRTKPNHVVVSTEYRIQPPDTGKGLWCAISKVEIVLFQMWYLKISCTSFIYLLEGNINTEQSTCIEIGLIYAVFYCYKNTCNFSKHYKKSKYQPIDQLNNFCDTINKSLLLELLDLQYDIFKKFAGSLDAYSFLKNLHYKVFFVSYA